MSRKTVFWGLTLGIAIVISGVMISLTLMAGQAQASTVGENISYQYVLKTWENQIGIFEKGSSTPMKVLEVSVNTLPYLEQTALENGIYVKDEEELRRMTEDFTG